MTIKTAIESVMMQTYINYEHIIMDSCSNDKTGEIVKSYKSSKIRYFVEKDNGCTDGLNKGIEKITGDIVYFLCCDDILFDENVFQDVINCFENNKKLEMCFSDIVFVKRDNTKEILRYWKSSNFEPGIYNTGWIPAFTSLFVTKSALQQSGSFDLQFTYGADLDIMYRFLEKDRLVSKYIPRVLVKMRAGGMSNAGIIGIVNGLKIYYDVLKFHGMKFPFISIPLTLIYRSKQLIIPNSIRQTVVNSRL